MYSQQFNRSSQTRERQAQVVYVVGEAGGAAQLIDADRRESSTLAEAAALMHTLADRIETFKRRLQR